MRQVNEMKGYCVIILLELIILQESSWSQAWTNLLPGSEHSAPDFHVERLLITHTQPSCLTHAALYFIPTTWTLFSQPLSRTLVGEQKCLRGKSTYMSHECRPYSEVHFPGNWQNTRNIICERFCPSLCIFWWLIFVEKISDEERRLCRRLYISTYLFTCAARDPGALV